jgi:hypothetical protein
MMQERQLAVERSHDALDAPQTRRSAMRGMQFA